MTSEQKIDSWQKLEVIRFTPWPDCLYTQREGGQADRQLAKWGGRGTDSDSDRGDKSHEDVLASRDRVLRREEQA